MATITCRMTAYLYVEPLDGYAGTSITCNVTLSSGSGTLGSLSINSSSSSYDYTWTKDVSFTSTNTSVTYTLSERSSCGSRNGKGTRTLTGNLQSGSLSTTFNPVYNTSNTASASLRIDLEYISGGGGGGGSTPTATASPPTSVRVGGSSTHSANAAVYNTTASDSNRGKFYITWTNTGSVTNQTKRGYQRRADGSAYGGSVYIVPDTYTTGLYSLSDGWGSGAVGKTYKCQVRTVGSSVTSAWSSSYGSVKFSAAVTNRTITGNANGGSPNRSKTATEGTAVEMAAPLRRGYNFGGWYFNSTASNCLDYSTIHNYTSSFTVSFWTYASTYAQGSKATPVSIVSCAQDAGWCLSCEDGKNWAFQLWDGSRWCEAIYARANISAGRHYWCLVFDSSAGTIKMYIDGSQKASASVPNKKVVYNSSSNHLLLGAELGASNAMASGSGFVGYIGNFKITNDATYRTYQSSEFMIPTSSPTVYAYWSKIGGKIYYNAGQYFTGNTNNPQPDMGIIKSGYTMQSYGGHYGFAANSSGTLYSPSYYIDSTAVDLYNTTTLFDAPPGCKHSPEASQWKIWNNTEGVWVNTAGISAASWNVGALVSNGTIEPGDELIAFANWLPNTYTLTFDPNGGICSTTTKTVTYGTTYTDLPTATKEGYIFKGWAANFNGSSDFINYGRRYMFSDKLSIHVSVYMDTWTDQVLLSSTEAGGIAFDRSNGNIMFYCYNYNNAYVNAVSSVQYSSLSSGWHDFDATFNGSVAKLYLDRTLIATSSTFSSGKIGYNKTNSLFIGAEAGSAGDQPASNYFSGKIGNIVILKNSDLQTATYNSFTAPAQNVTLKAIWERGGKNNMYVYNGSTWKIATPYVYNGSQWKPATAYIYDGSKWKQASSLPD